MLIQSYGLFWERNEINWFPGGGNRGEFLLLGRQGKNANKLQLCDFRKQKGIYILYGDHGPYYVGLVRARGLGLRLQEHWKDNLKGKWNRFSWFGFVPVLKARDPKSGLRLLKNKMAKIAFGAPNSAIKDMEALLIKAIGPRNVADMNFTRATEWIQVRYDEYEKYLGRAKQS